MEFVDLKDGMLVFCNRFTCFLYVSTEYHEDDGEPRIIGIDSNDPYFGMIHFYPDLDEKFFEVCKIGSKEYIEILSRMLNKREKAKDDAEYDCMVMRNFINKSRVSKNIEDTEWS